MVIPISIFFLLITEDGNCEMLITVTLSTEILRRYFTNVFYLQPIQEEFCCFRLYSLKQVHQQQVPFKDRHIYKLFATTHVKIPHMRLTR